MRIRALVWLGLGVALAGCGGSKEVTVDGSVVVDAAVGRDAARDPCSPGEPVPPQLVCDGVMDCADGRDENIPGCCRGCKVGTRCEPGTSPNACGEGNIMCVVCAANQQCVDGQCQIAPTCSQTSCPSGCCMGDVCTAGTAAAACGSSGAQCEVCSGGASCESDGTGRRGCRVVCGPSTCNGCCDATGTCRTGTSNAVCGTGGALCTACSGSNSCSNGQCTSSACQATCDGCCRPDGTCVPFEMSAYESTVNTAAHAACGIDGAACDACTSNEVCRYGCVAIPCTQTCGGCCDDAGNCQPGTSAAQCGAGANRCLTCTAPFGCELTPQTTYRQCDVAPTSRWVVEVLALTVPALDGTSSWDAFGGLPDIFVSVDGNAQTPTRTNATSATWSGTEAATVTLMGSNAYYISFYAYDEDPTFDDRIMDCSVSLNPLYNAKAARSAFSGALQECSENGATIRWRLRALP